MQTVILYFLVAPVMSLQAEILTLEKAQLLAAGAGTELAMSELENQLANANLKIARSAFFPTFGLEGGYQKFDSDEERLSGTYGYLFGEYKFDLAGSDYFNYRAIQKEVQIAEVKVAQTRLASSWAVETKFSEVLYLQEASRLYLWAIDENKKYAQMARKKRDTGQASDADIIEFDLSESTLRSDLEENLAERTRALGELKALLNLDHEREIELQGELPHFHIQEGLSELQERLANTNTEIKTATLEMEKLDALNSSAYEGYIPELSLRSTYGRRGRDEPKGPEQTYALVATWEFFSGFKDAGQLQRASLLSQKAQLERKIVSIKSPANLEAEFKKYMSLQNRVDLESQNRARSKRYLTTVLDEYRRGVKNSADLRFASLQILEASLKDLRYRFEGIKQKEVLQKTLGDSIGFDVSPTDHKIK